MLKLLFPNPGKGRVTGFYEVVFAFVAMRSSVVKITVPIQKCERYT